MALPLLFFVVLLWLDRDELGVKGIPTCLGVCVGLVSGCAILNISPYVLIALLALIDVVLVLVIFGRDIRIRRASTFSLNASATGGFTNTRAEALTPSFVSP